MWKLFRYFKPYLLLVILCIGLLFVQAMAELSLPNYMSDIVNVGIQQAGVESAVPQVVRASRMDQLKLFMTRDESLLVDSAFTLVQPGSEAAADLLEKYPALKNEPVFILSSADSESLPGLEKSMSRAWMAVTMLEMATSSPESAAQLNQLSGMDLTRLPAGTDAFALLAQMPEEQRAQLITLMDEKFSTMGESMVKQSAMSAVKGEYAAIGVNQSRIQTAYIVRIGGVMLLITLLITLSTISVSLLASRTASGLSRDIRRDEFRKVENFSRAEFDSFSTASLITRTTNDVTQLQNVVLMGLRMVFFSPMMAVGAIIRAVDKSPSMTWIIGLGVAVLLAVITLVFSLSLPKFKLMQKLVDRLNLVTRENLSGMMVIRAFNTQNFELGRFDDANSALTKNTLFISRVMMMLFPAMTLIMNGLSILIIWVGAHQIAASGIQVGDMMAFLQYSMHVVFSFLMMSFAFIMLPRAAVSAGRVAEVLQVEPSIKDPVAPKPFSNATRGLVEFKNVSFRYPNAEENVLCNISFTAKPGQTTAIIGSTGSGKSTVINLIPRFFDVSEGAVQVDGVDVRDVSQSDLRERIGYIPQRGILFSGTVQSNLRFADDDASLETLQKAADIAQASQFISQMEGGMDAEISQGGTNVSGGQKQRLAIARALVKKPPIYIFDDALSALDFKTDAALRRALNKETGSSTMIIVTQRISTIKNADQIIVLDEGQLVGKGTHTELMKTCDTYREMALSQLTGEELSL